MRRLGLVLVLGVLLGPAAEASAKGPRSFQRWLGISKGPGIHARDPYFQASGTWIMPSEEIEPGQAVPEAKETSVLRRSPTGNAVQQSRTQSRNEER